jgi:hypothetical protein
LGHQWDVGCHEREEDCQKNNKHKEKDEEKMLKDTTADDGSTSKELKEKAKVGKTGTTVGNAKNAGKSKVKCGKNTAKDTKDKLGCSKCRFAVKGCARCRQWA